MNHRLVTFLLLSIAILTTSAQDVERQSFEFGDTTRTYSMYLPSSIEKNAPLVVYAHGYSSRTRYVKDLNTAAERHGFAVCYPDGAPDSREKDGWNVGYPSQFNMPNNEQDFFKALLDEVCSRFSLSRTNVFLTGMSNGGDLCYHFAYTCPNLFKAYASVSGLTFEYVYNNRKLTDAVPFLEIHGNADKVSMWQGDHHNTGGWGAYIPVPLAVAAIAANNRCTTLVSDTIYSQSAPQRMIMRSIYSGSPSGADVVVYEVDGGKHSWFAKDLDTGEIIWQFFKPYIIKNF